MSKEAATSRFGHLLQPIRDLSKVWKIEIAEELEKYIEELGQLPAAADPSQQQQHQQHRHQQPKQGAASQLNFAEAALLVQGSTAIYSRKVELLYQLVYQALDLIPEKESKDHGKKKHSKLLSSHPPQSGGLWAPIPETEELLTIGHLIKEGRNTLLDRTVAPQRQATQHRVPLFLLPRDEAGLGAGKQSSTNDEKGEGLESGSTSQKECRLGSCTVHHSGAFLLQESDAKLLDRMIDGKEDWGMVAGGPLVPTPPREVQDLDSRLQEILRGDRQESALGAEADSLDMELEAPPVAPGSPAPATPPPRGSEASPHSMGLGLDDGSFGGGVLVADDDLGLGGGQGAGGGGGGGGGRASTSRRSSEDFWAPLDEHASLGSDVPLQVGKTSRFPAAIAKHLMVPLDKLPPRVEQSYFLSADDAAQSDQEKWKRGEGEKVMAKQMANGNPVDALFLATALQGKAGGPKMELLKAGFSAAWLEFEDVFARLASKAASQRRREFPKGRASDARSDPGAAPEEGDIPVPDAVGFDESEAMVDNSFGPDFAAAGSSTQLVGTPERLHGLDHDFSPLQDMEEAARQDRREEVVRLETMIEDAQARYEATIRQHLQSLGKDGGDNRYGQLYANVKRWQDQLAPVLREFHSRPEFDIQNYSTNFLTDIQKPSSAAAGLDGEQDENLDPSAGGSLPTVKFSRLVEGQPRWEVCRRFLTCLFLTNHGNTEIVPSTSSSSSSAAPAAATGSEFRPAGDEAPSGDFLVRLVKADCNSISLNMEEAVERPRMQRKARAPLAVLQEGNVDDDAASRSHKEPPKKKLRRVL